MTEDMFCKDVKKLSKEDTRLAGGKGASLGEMTQAKIPVPPGFVILTKAFERFLQKEGLHTEIDAILHKVDHKAMHTVEQASNEIQALILQTDLPQKIASSIIKSFDKLHTKYVAVRSSATAEDSSTAAWAGQLESYLNTKKDSLLENVKKCWASLFTPRAIFYRFEQGLHGQAISVAVVVQKMVESKVSGVAFSVHPITQDKNQVLIEAGYGLGEAIVSGQITPDSYVIEKSNNEIVESNINDQCRALYRSVSGGNKWRDIKTSKKQKLTNNQIKELADMVIKIETHYGFPVDIEWALEKNKFYIVQSRPITTLLRGNINSQDTFKVANRILKQYQVHPPFIHKGFHAYFYPIDFVQLIWNQWGKYSGYYYKLHISALHSNYWDLYYIPDEFTALRNHYFQRVHKNKSYLEKHYKDWKESCSKLSRLIDELDSSFKNQDFKKIFEGYRSFVNEYIFEYALAAPIQEACGFQPEQWINPLLEEFCQKYKLPYQETSALLSSPVIHSFIAEEEIDLLKINLAYKIDKDTKKLQKALLKHQKKWFWVQNNYATIKSVSLDELEKRSEAIQKFTLQKIKEKIDSLEKMPSETKDKKKMLFREHKPTSKLKLYIKITELFAEMQDIRKSFVLRANHYHKLFLEAVSLKYQQPLENLWCYSYNELSNAIKNNSFIGLNEIEKRKEMIIEVESNKEKIIISGNEAKYFFEKLQEKVGDLTEFGGIVAQPGKVQGRVVIVLKSHDLLKVSAGDILVSSMTRPEMTIAMQKAAGFVTDEGGITSHAAIVSRELKKPCIIGTKVATKILKSGDIVEVDANRGIVRIIKRG